MRGRCGAMKTARAGQALKNGCNGMIVGRIDEGRVILGMCAVGFTDMRCSLFGVIYGAVGTDVLR